MKYPRPLKNSLDALHPVCALKNLCYDAADRERVAVDAGNAGTDATDYDAERRMLVYGKLWHVLLIVWDELNGQDNALHEPDDEPFVDRIIAAFDGDLDDVMTAMYG